MNTELLKPTEAPVMQMTWHDLLFAHWRVDAAAMASAAAVHPEEAGPEISEI